MERVHLTNACNRLAETAFFGPRPASGICSYSTLRHGRCNRSGRHSEKCATIQANAGVAAKGMVSKCPASG